MIEENNIDTTKPATRVSKMDFTVNGKKVDYSTHNSVQNSLSTSEVTEGSTLAKYLNEIESGANSDKQSNETNDTKEFELSLKRVNSTKKTDTLNNSETKSEESQKEKISNSKENNSKSNIKNLKERAKMESRPAARTPRGRRPLTGTRPVKVGDMMGNKSQVTSSHDNGAPTRSIRRNSSIKEQQKEQVSVQPKQEQAKKEEVKPVEVGVAAVVEKSVSVIEDAKQEVSNVTADVTTEVKEKTEEVAVKEEPKKMDLNSTEKPISKPAISANTLKIVSLEEFLSYTGLNSEQVTDWVIISSKYANKHGRKERVSKDFGIGYYMSFYTAKKNIVVSIFKDNVFAVVELNQDGIIIDISARAKVSEKIALVDSNVVAIAVNSSKELEKI